MGRRLTTEEFIERAKKVHGDRYDYSLVDYKGSREKVKIICEVHGVFEQRANSHLNNKGCKSCGGTSKLTIKNFINKANKIHQNKYIYPLINYTNSKTKIDIICSIHGLFKQTPNDHLMGHGCPTCGNNKKSTTEEFIEKAKKIHNEKYMYEYVKYRNAKIKVEITCPIHGLFKQTPNDHLMGHGCPTCGNIIRAICSFDKNKTFHKIKGYLYVIVLTNELESFLKIGISTNLKVRFKEYTNYKIKPIYIYELDIEKALHKEQSIINKYKAYKYIPVYRFKGRTECFPLNFLSNIKKELNL